MNDNRAPAGLPVSHWVLGGVASVVTAGIIGTFGYILALDHGLAQLANQLVRVETEVTASKERVYRIDSIQQGVAVNRNDIDRVQRDIHELRMDTKEIKQIVTGLHVYLTKEKDD